MLDKANFKIQVATILEERNWIGLCNLLEEKFKINLNTPDSLQVTSNEILILSEVLSSIRKLLSCENDNFFKVVRSFYKALRNVVACSSDAQTLFCDHPSVLNDTFQILKSLMELNEHGLDSIKMLLQFLINSVVNNVHVNRKVWNIFQDVIKELFSNKICLYHTSALVYNIFHNDGHLLRENAEIIEYVLDSYKQNNSNEYLTFLLELFIKNVDLNKTYVIYNAEHRMLCLEIMKEMLNTDKTWLTEELITVLSGQFKQKSDCILKTVTDYLKHIEPFEVTLLLELLAAISSDEILVKYIQKDKSLLINCTFLLKSIHSVGKQSDNNFSTIPKLSQLDDLDMEILQHPSYGFKASIIRLLANLCWKHTENQNEIRELDCIPLLLDCCNIDARNPFIMQWVIFAIRNLCESNIENQKLILAMNQEGVVSSATLLEMGIDLHSDEKHTIKIVPLNFNK